MRLSTLSTFRFKLLAKLFLFGCVAITPLISTASANVPNPQGCANTTVLLPGKIVDEAFGITGSIVGTTGLANTTITWNISQTSAGVLSFSTSRNGPFTPTITVPMPLDGSGSGQISYFVKGLTSGHSVIVESSAQCGGGAPQCGGLIPPADYTVKGCACPAIPNIQ